MQAAAIAAYPARNITDSKGGKLEFGAPWILFLRGYASALIVQLVGSWD